MNKELKELRKYKKDARLFFWMIIILLIAFIIYLVSRYCALYQILGQNPRNPNDVVPTSSWVSIVSGLVVEIIEIALMIHALVFLQKIIRDLEEQEREIKEFYE